MPPGQPEDPFDVVPIGEAPYSHALQHLPIIEASSLQYPLHFQPAHNIPLDYASGLSSTLQSLTTSSTLDSKLELPPRDRAVRRGVLQESYFPTWTDDTAGGLDSPEELQKKDPLGTQIWKLYSKAKSQLPNAERMENLTWRMMSMNLRKLELERSKGLVPTNPRRLSCLRPFLSFHSANRTINRMNRHATTAVLSAPSGIAQLRKASDYSSASMGHTPMITTNNNHDPMNLDDFIIPTSIGTPAGLSPSPSTEKMAHSANAVASAIPIRRQSQMSAQDDHMSRASAPVIPPNIRKEPEFGYVQRHVRKTSIDERRVSFALVLPWRDYQAER
jgi:GATA-binding protein, other eukaryote